RPRRRFTHHFQRKRTTPRFDCALCCKARISSSSLITYAASQPKGIQMTATTSANPTTSAQTATVPSIRLLQMDPAAIGRIAGSVNLFRGDVLLPLELLSLTSRGGLEAKVAASYQSNVFHDVNTWNVEAPTGILGLGWSMSYDAIIADHGDSISPFDTTFYMVDPNGGQTRLYL